MSVIDRIELYYATTPLPAPFSPAWVPGASRAETSFYLIHLVTDDGVEGWSAMSGNGPEKAGGAQLLNVGCWLQTLVQG